MPKEDNKVLKHIQGEKSMKVGFITCADLEYMSTSYNNPKTSSTTKINKHAASGYSLFTYRSSNTRKNKLDCYSGNDCMERFSKDLKKHSTKKINYEKKKKEMVPLTNEENIASKKYVIYAKKNLVLMIKNIKRLKIIITTVEDREELLMISAIEDAKHQNKFL